MALVMTTVRRSRTVVVAGLVGTLLLLAPTSVFAHAGVVRTTPADGERLSTAPPSFAIEFSEPVGIDPDGIRVVDATGAPVELPTGARAEGAIVVQELPALDDGWYQASWSVVSSDGHVVHGAIAFAVGDATGPPPDATTSDPAAVTIALVRGIADLGLIMAVGAMAAWVVLGARRPRVRRLAITASLIGAAASIALVALTVADAGQTALTGTAALSTLVRAGLLVGAAAGAAIGSWRVSLVLAGAALTTMALGGHPSERPLTAGLVLLHLAAASVWLGAAPAVLLVLLDGQTDDAGALRVVRRFSRAATVVLVVVVGAGTALALSLTDARLDGLDPRYLGFLVVKVVLVLVAALLGASTRRRIGRDTAGRADLRRVFLVDTVLLVLVVACSAALTVGPPREVSVDDGIHVGHCPLECAEGVASLSLVPARVGDNTVFLDGAGALERALVELRLPGEAGAIEIELRPAGSGWTGAGAVPVAGVWDVTVAMQRDAFTVTRLPCQLRVAP